MEKDFVIEEVCAERQKNATEKMESVQSELKDKEERTRKIESLNIQMGEILKNHEAKLQNHDERLVALEAKPLKFWDKLQWLVIGAMVSGIATILLQAIAK